MADQSCTRRCEAETGLWRGEQSAGAQLHDHQSTKLDMVARLQLLCCSVVDAPVDGAQQAQSHAHMADMCSAALEWLDSNPPLISCIARSL